ncbi:hypothetical protein Back11_00160 [Paenibacillus baekrokdamisoli]|uniref:Uncharacterized protein n=1 Tax=Paenibacillus baekrokdamisoli TaxID=1712516 RepID=A0A3G9IYC0_9BACL|nr:hypothetical protein [Paenibacillus baekrokdamisoli]MBB3069361.1 hypothetical protein [Paenibacillus baekrokdamisoli]BBH18671.1 hypothetical protein Back11_00160 [Paenibacillus baekrokdamisoli]
MPASININAVDELLGFIRTDYRNLSVRELLHKSPHVLLGVSAQAADILQKLEINTVFDLATSGVFGAATKLVNAASDVHSALNQHGSPTADLVREAEAAGKKIDELQFLQVGVLESIPEAEVANVQSLLDVQTVRDLALYPPYRAAVRMLNAVYFPENVPNFDPERPADLLPKSGEYPTERVQYTTLLMDEIHIGDGETIADIASPNFKPLDLAKLASGDAGFKRIAFGALLTFTQSWYAQGVTLGQLLHSTSLAPGESTRIAVIDWSRKSRAGETEIISEVDDLTNDTSRNRSISEVTQAVADEAQGGFSKAHSNSLSTQHGSSSAEEISAPLGGLFGGPSASFGQSSSQAATISNSDSYSTSFGHRDIGSSMMQNVKDRTHQNAHSSRSRRASVVKEVSQTEHEGVSTRVLANYNHMHALTIQYYEVVQIYRVEVAIAKADKVVFIPVQLVDFQNDTMVRRFRNVLARAALTYEIREALHNLDVLEVSPEKDTHFTILGNRFSFFLREALLNRTGINLSTARNAKKATTDAAAAAVPETTSGTTFQPMMLSTTGQSTNIRLSDALPIVQQVNDHLWSIDQTARLSGLLNRSVLRSDSNAIYLPTDVTVEGGVVSTGGTPMKILFHTQQNTTVDTVSAEHPLAMSEVKSIGIIGSSKEREISATLTLTLNRNGVRFPLELPAVTVAKSATGEIRVVQVKPGGVNANLKQHLNENRMHYSQAIFRSLDSTQIALLLSGYGVEVNDQLVPVAQVVEPRPIRYVGNYLAFKMNTDASSDDTWASWLREHGIQLGSSKEDIVPLPSGGTFAEAVLGRSNCAEKLDITRFWNWQDSPIPLQPTEIAAVQTGSRATNEDVKPGQLSSPIINITSPASIPDPSGTAAILAAIQNGNMFRDMSGLQGTIGLAQAALQATSAGAATAGQQAGTNMNSLLQANTERQRIAAEMITSLAKTAASVYSGGLAGGGGGGISGGSNHSQDGAKINYFDKTQGQATAGGSNAVGGSAVTPVGGGGQSGGGSGGNAGGGSGTNGSSGGSFSQNPAALAATWGDSQSPSGLIDKIVDKYGGIMGGGDASPSSSPLTTRKAWPKLDSSTVLTRINDLKGNANLFDQGKVGLCTAAAFYHHVIQKNATEFELFAKALYGGGIGFLGKLKVNPGSDLRNTDYSALAAEFPGMPRQAEWMLMSSVRDSENWFFDYEGAPDESTSIKTSAIELSEWYTKTGFYSGVTYSDDTSLAKIKAIQKTATNHIALYIRIPLLQPGTSTHIITLEGPITIDEPNDKVTFDYWTWGQPIRTLNTTLTALKANYLGVITATF